MRNLQAWNPVSTQEAESILREGRARAAEAACCFSHQRFVLLDRSGCLMVVFWWLFQMPCNGPQFLSETPRAREIVHFLVLTLFFFSPLEIRTRGGREMAWVGCLSNSATKCCFPRTIYLENCLSHYLSPKCLKQMVLYALTSRPSHFNRRWPVVWASRPEKEERLHFRKCGKMRLVGDQEVLVIWVCFVMCL